jgi:protein SCO1/2
VSACSAYTRSVLRRLLILAPLAVAALVAAVVVALGIGGGGDSRPDLNAGPVSPPVPAPRTAGVGADGAPVDLPAEGRPMLVTFLFANCPTVCPLIAQQLSAALDDVGPDASEIDVVAVSVDPEGDTPQAVRRYLRGHDLDGRMRYIVGSAAELRPLWEDWQVSRQPTDQVSLSLHSARIVLVDRDGEQVGRYSGGLPIPPRHIAEDIRTLIA